MAISDPQGSIAQGLDTLQRRTLPQDVTRVAQIAKERKAEMILIGLPLHMSGDESEMSAFARKFGARLQEAVGLPVEFQDERLTSVEAEDRMRQRGMGLERMLAEKRKGTVDRLAATVLLEDYLRRLELGQ